MAMIEHPLSLQVTPPLSLAWRTNTSFVIAIAGDASFYGLTLTGKIQAFSPSTGAVRWESSTSYVGARLVRQGSRLFAYRLKEGLGYLDDKGTTVTEHLGISFTASADTNMSSPVLDDRMVYLAVNRGLLAYHQEKGLQFGKGLSDVVPHSIGLITSSQIVVIDGHGIPARYEVTDSDFKPVWAGDNHGINDGQRERPFIIVHDRLIIGVGAATVAYDLQTGKIAWKIMNVPARAFTATDEVVFAAFHGASLWAIRSSDGVVLWHRQYLYDISLSKDYGLAVLGGNLYFGGTLQLNPDGAILLAVDATNGSFVWLSRSASTEWVGGLPVTDGQQILCFGHSKTGSYKALPQTPRVASELILVAPRPVRGASSNFGTGSVAISLPVSAKVSIAAYREQTGLGSIIVNRANWSPGLHESSWQISSPSGYSDANQFGYILVDVTEDNGLAYTHSLLLPVNTFPDILGHWARLSIETMIFHKYVNGYADQTFKPDNFINRAESSTIISKTLNLDAPSPGFKSLFTDIATHWARNYIMALEEKGIVGGFKEPNGTYTFRPDLNMTRAQEAKILVKAYNIPTAPVNFVSKFTDIAGHWAESDIKALEAAGYVSGFRESNGSYTYRPEQNITRAELSTVVVRILKLTR